MSLAAQPSFEEAWPFIDRVPGFLVSGQERYLFEKARSLPDDAVIVEIGSFYGRSSCALGMGCVGSRRRIYCIDPWVMTDLGDIDFFDTWEANVSACGVRDRIVPLRGRSQEVLAEWAELAGGAPIDFIFIDGWHEYGPALRDLQLAFPLVKDNGWIAMHDVCDGWPGTKRVWYETAAPSLTRHEYCSTLACGVKTPGLPLRQTACPSPMPASSLPVQYFTEVGLRTGDLSGIPAVLERLEFPWCWHIVLPSPLAAGEANSTPLGNGTIRLHPPPTDFGWLDSVQARNAVLATIDAECLLWELEPAHGWSAEGLTAGRLMFVQERSRTGAYVLDSSGLACSRPIAWHCYPWFRWINPTVPQLAAIVANGGWYDVASARPFTAEQTAARGLRIQPLASARVRAA